MSASNSSRGDSPQDPVAQRVSVVIPVFNGGADLDHCLVAVAASSYPVFETVLVDDGSTDGLTEPAALRHGARVIKLGQQSGPAIARNRGAREARGDILIFTDADVLIHPDAIAVAVKALETDPGLSAVFGSYDDQPGHESFLSQYRNLYHHWVHQTGNEEASTFWTGCGAIRRNAFIDLGGFSQEYGRPSIEDIELGTRLRRAGHRIRLERTMLGKHTKHWRFWNLVKTDIFHRGVPWMSLLLRDRTASRDLNLNLSSRMATVLAGLLGLSLVVLPITGHLAALWPAAALLLAAGVGAWLSGLALGHKVASIIATALMVAAPVAVESLTPDPWAVLPLVLILALVWIQRAFFQYVSQRRGGAFAIAVIPMQVVFFLSCAAAVPLALIEHHFGKRPGR